MDILFFALLLAFIVTNYTLPHVISVALEKKLGAVPNARSSHTNVTPVLGGIGILAGILTPILVLGKQLSFWGFSLIFVAIGIVFLIGLKDDLLEIKPLKKLLGQLFAASLVIYSGIQLTNLHGIFGVNELPAIVGIGLSIFIIIVIVNAFNLIDGINGLSGGISLLVSSVLGIWFYLVGEMEFALIGFAIAGALIAFLRFNITPAKIFMGDSGSLVLGLLISVLMLKFIEFHAIYPDNQYAFHGVPAIAISILIFPLFDTLRVFTMRILKGRSPLSPDRNHIHHMLIDAGFSHTQASGILIFLNGGYILLAMTFNNLGTFTLLTLVLISCIGLTLYLRKLVKQQKSMNKIIPITNTRTKPLYSNQLNGLKIKPSKKVLANE